MKREHDEIASVKRKENYSKIWFVKALELLKQEKIKFKSVVDIGAGKGEFLEILKDNFDIPNTVGVDYIESDLRTLTSKGIKAIKVDLDNFKVEDYSDLKNNFDLVVCLAAIEHVFNADRLFQFFYHLLKEKGHLLITTPNMGAFHFRLFYLLRGYPLGEGHHVRFFNKKKLRQHAFFNGFDPVKWNNYFTSEPSVIKRGFGVRNKYLAYFLAMLFFGPLLIFQKLKLFGSLTNNHFVILFRKTNFSPLNLQIDNFKKNFEQLPDEKKQLWINRIRKYYKKDKLKEHIYFKSYIEKII